MKVGLLTSILEQWDFEEVVDIASKIGFESLEVACWPIGDAERRYAGVSHKDVVRIAEDEEYKQHILDCLNEKGITISALAYYPNTMDPDLEKRKINIQHLKKVIIAADLLNVGMVTTFIGKDQFKSIDDNLKLLEQVWPDIISFAEAHKVKIAIENCPMLFGKEQWPGGQNLMSTPILWKTVFERFPSDYLGLNYDPSHLVWQQINYIKPIEEFRDKIFHVHIKDIKLLTDKLEKCGTMAYPLDYMIPKIPGLGDVKWGKFISALTDIGYDGTACIEVEDKTFENEKEDIIKSIEISKRYIQQYI